MNRLLAWLLGGTLAVVSLSAIVVYSMDPYFHYHDPDVTGEVWIDERYLAAGLLRTQSYDTILMGTSLAANYQPSWFDSAFGGQTVQVTLPNGSTSEFDTALTYGLSCQEVKQVIFGLDGTLLTQSTEDQTQVLPTYLYNQNPLDDLPYLLNKDVLAKSIYTYQAQQAGALAPLDTAFLWDYDFSKALAIVSYPRPDISPVTQDDDYYLPTAAAHLDTITQWLETNPEVEFHFYLSPYSILFWDKMDREGTLEAMLTTVEYAMGRLTAYDNATVHFFMGDIDIITNLDLYTDHIHASTTVTTYMVSAMEAGTHVVSAENCSTLVDELRQFVVHYEYEEIFE